jgi:hypothetical protein
VPSADAAPPRPNAAAEAEAAWAHDRAFIGLLNAYRAHGGFACLRHRSGAASTTVRAEDPIVRSLVDAGHLFGFDWHHALWIPRFQFDGSGLQVAPGPRRVVAELGPAFDGWAMADWFVQTHSDLAGRSPIACLATRLADVLQAARIDRYLATA